MSQFEAYKHEQRSYFPAESPTHLASMILSNARQAINGFNTNEALYRIKVRLHEQSINAYGQAQMLKPGMTLEADVIQDKRRIWEWVLEPVLAMKQRAWKQVAKNFNIRC